LPKASKTNNRDPIIVDLGYIKVEQTVNG